MTAQTQTDFREETNWRELHLSTSERNIGLGIVALLILTTGVVLGATWFGGDNTITSNQNTLHYFSNLFTEFLSIFVTVALFSAVFEFRRVQLLKEELLRNASKRSNPIALNAIEDLYHHHWNHLLEGALLYHANLQGVKMTGANLKDAILCEANLQQADLYFANLQNADLLLADMTEANLHFARMQSAQMTNVNLQRAFLFRTNLQDANIENGNLEGASIVEADLEKANLWSTNLLNADLRKSNLAGANLSDANLEGVSLKDAIFDENTILPDETVWSPHTDLTKFTTRTHPDFWRSDKRGSPARDNDITESE